jgi:ADP-ribose pyrophosphatase YjhB (NUDIX family)
MNYTFCPRCGAPLSEQVAFGRPRRVCRYCGFIHFKDPKVAVAALVSADGRVLLVRRAVMPGIGLWALPAGYMDQDESPQEALAREVSEETGLTVRPGALHSIAALGGWEERRGILLLYHAELAESVTPAPATTAPVAGDDVSEARWFTSAEVPWGELAFESTEAFLRDWAQGLDPSFSPPGDAGPTR